MPADADLDCREVARLVALRRERGLAPQERAALKRHLAACLACSNFEQQIEFLERAAARWGSDPAR